MDKTPLDKLDDVLAIQTAPGNGRDDPGTGYVADDYMRGLANGLILAEHIMRDRHGDPDYVPPPISSLRAALEPRSYDRPAENAKLRAALEPFAKEADA
jgi:hypothetical protein